MSDCENCDMSESRKQTKQQTAQIAKLEAEKEEYHNQYHLCEAKLLSHKSIIKQDGELISKLQAELAAAKQELETAYDVCAEKITKLQEKGQIDE